MGLKISYRDSEGCLVILLTKEEVERINEQGVRTEGASRAGEQNAFTVDRAGNPVWQGGWMKKNRIGEAS